jgi:hypothetical protein
MKLSSKLTLAIAAASVICPIAANAAPITGSTAATVSIKFNDCKCGPTSGQYSITPGGNATGSGSGVKELSAAVATGETKAEANSMSNYSGTSASATGFSKPVTFTYVNTSDISNRTDTSNYSYNSTSQNNKDQKSAWSKKTTDAETYNAANATAGNATNGTNGKGETSNVTANSASGFGSDGSGDSQTSSGKKGSSYSTSSNTSSGSKNSTENSTLDTAKSQSSNSQDGLTTAKVDNTSNTLNTTKNGTSYNYTGSSAGLANIPIIK